MIRGQVLDDDKRETGVFRHVLKESFEGLETARGSSKCRDWEVVFAVNLDPTGVFGNAVFGSQAVMVSP